MVTLLWSENGLPRGPSGAPDPSLRGCVCGTMTGGFLTLFDCVPSLAVGHANFTCTALLCMRSCVQWHRSGIACYAHIPVIGMARDSMRAHVYSQPPASTTNIGQTIFPARRILLRPREQVLCTSALGRTLALLRRCLMCLAAILQMQLNNVLLHSQASHWALRLIGPCVNVVGGNLPLGV